MRITPLPAEDTYVLAEHHHPRPMVDGPEGPVPDADATPVPLDGAPVFVFRPLDPRARTKWLNLLFDPREDLNPLSNEKYLDMFDERLVRIDNLEVGPEGSAVPFDKAKHLIHVPMEWQMEVAMNILTRARFSEDDAGK